MNLMNCIMRPGKVLEVNVEDKVGYIKASAPGLFSQEDPVENLPYIMPSPFMLGNSKNSFSMPKVEDEVWIMNVKDNPLQLYWMRKDDYITTGLPLKYNTVADNSVSEEEITMDGCEVFEVLCNIPNEETGGASLFYSDQSGWIVNQAGSTIQMDKDGNINISVASDKSMNINSPKMVIDSDEIVFNKGENKELVNIEVLEESLNQIYEYIGAIKDKINMAVPIPCDGGAGLKALIYANLAMLDAQYASPLRKYANNFGDTKITH